MTAKASPAKQRQQQQQQQQQMQQEQMQQDQQVSIVNEYDSREKIIGNIEYVITATNNIFFSFTAATAKSVNRTGCRTYANSGRAKDRFSPCTWRDPGWSTNEPHSNINGSHRASYASATRYGRTTAWLNGNRNWSTAHTHINPYPTSTNAGKILFFHNKSN